MNHTRTYPLSIEEFRKHLDNRNEQLMIESAKNLCQREAEFHQKLKTLEAVLTCPRFAKHVTHRKDAKKLSAVVRKMIYSGDALLWDLKKFANNVEADPKRWIQELKP